jgi:hypothetical protein
MKPIATPNPIIINGIANNSLSSMLVITIINNKINI